jgi:hypothetical protein
MHSDSTVIVDDRTSYTEPPASIPLESNMDETYVSPQQSPFSLLLSTLIWVTLPSKKATLSALRYCSATPFLLDRSLIGQFARLSKDSRMALPGELPASPVTA